MKKLRKIYFLGISALFLQGCINPGVDSQLMADIRAGERGPIDPSVLPKIPEEFVTEEREYLGSQYLSPFYVPPFAEAALTESEDGEDGLVSAVVHVDPRRPEGYQPETLESVALDALRMVGVMQAEGTNKYVALLSTPDGLIHQVMEGDYIGLQFGKITKITEQYVELEEVEFSAGNEWRTKDAFLQLETIPL